MHQPVGLLQLNEAQRRHSIRSSPYPRHPCGGSAAARHICGWAMQRLTTGWGWAGWADPTGIGDPDQLAWDGKSLRGSIGGWQPDCCCVVRRGQGLSQASPFSGNRQGCCCFDPKVVGGTRSHAMNLMTVDGYNAKIEYDAETDLFRGEILGLSGGADFTAPIQRSSGRSSNGR